MVLAAAAASKSFSSWSTPTGIESITSILKLRRPAWRAPTETRVLRTDLPPELQRGARLSVALQGVGHHWGSSATDLNGFELSETAQELHTFISHNWGQSRWRKVVALHLHFFSVPALLVGTIVASLVAILQSRQLQVLPTCSEELWPRPDGQLAPVAVGCFAFPAGSAAFAAVLLGGPSFLGRLRRCDPLVFLDKLCIHKADVEMNEQGILGLGSFLLRSRHLLVLWSPEYLSRMWCIYEIACWAAHGKQEVAPAVLQPTALSWSLALSCCAGFAAFGVLKVMVTIRPGGYDSGVLDQLLVLIIICAFIVLWLHRTRLLMCDVVKMREQLRTFRFEEARCFCCSNNHRHPQTGLALPCDRALVRRSIAGWFAEKRRPGQGGGAGHDEAASPCGNEEGESEDGIRNFDRYVQESLGPQLLQHGVAGSLSYMSALSFVAGCFFSQIDFYVAFISWGVAPRAYVATMAWPLLGFPLGLKMGLMTSELFATRFGRPENRLVNLLITAMHGFLLCTYAALFQILLVVTEKLQSPWRQVSLIAVLVLVNLTLFAPCCFGSGWPHRSESQRLQELQRQEKWRQETWQQEGQHERGQQVEPEKEIQQQEEVYQQEEVQQQEEV